MITGSRIEEQNKKYIAIAIDHLNIDEKNIKMVVNEQINGVDTKRITYSLCDKLGLHNVNIRIDTKEVINAE